MGLIFIVSYKNLGLILYVNALLLSNRPKFQVSGHSCVWMINFEYNSGSNLKCNLLHSMPN